MKDTDYVKSKVRHMKATGTNADINPDTGAARPDHVKAEAEERRANQARATKRRAEKEKKFYKEFIEHLDPFPPLNK